MTRRRMRLADLLPIVLLAAALASTAARAGEELLVIRAARVLTGDGGDLADAVIVIEGGRIKAVGKDVEVPWDARVIRAPGVVTAGLIEPHATSGLRVVNENLPDVPYLSVLDGLDPNSPDYRAALRDGITAIHVIPGNSTRFGGMGAVVRPVGTLPEDMAIVARSALKISLAPPGGDTRMAHMAQIRRTFLDLHSYLAGLAPPPPAGLLAARPVEPAGLSALLVPAPDWKAIDWEKLDAGRIEEQRRPLADLVRGRLPAFIYCQRASDVFKAFELMDTHGLRAVLVLGPDGFRAAGALRARKDLLPVILDSDLVQYEDDPDTGEEERRYPARVLHEAGVRFALQAEEDRSGRQPLSRDPASHLWFQAARLVQQGLSREEALRSVTLHPAAALGLEHRMGSLAVGKDANLAVFTGDPFDARSWVDLVLIEGRIVYRRSDDQELQALLRRPDRSF